LDEEVAVAKRESWEEGMGIGMERGMGIGEKRRAIAIARNLRARGMTVDEIADATDLTIDDVLRL